MKFSRLIASSAVAVLMATTTIAQDAPTAETVLATVNGQDITLGHVIALTNRLPERYKQAPNADLFEGVLEQLIQQTVLSAGQDANRKAVKLALENESRALLATEVLNHIEEAATTEELIEKAYTDKYTNGPAPQEYKAAHILVETEDEAKALLTSLEGGADFAELAKEKSTGPSGPTGGDLGWFGLGRMVPEFEQAVTTLKVGDVSAPVKTQFGWHVIKLNETRDLPIAPLVEVRAELITELSQQAVADHVEKMSLTADIQRSEEKIDPALIRNLDLLND